MGYKTILVHCDATRGAEGRLRIAVDIARQHGAHLIGLYVRQPFQAPMFTDASVAMDALYASYEETARSDEAASSATFQKVTAGAGGSSEWKERLLDTLTEKGMTFIADAVEHSDVIDRGNELELVTTKIFGMAARSNDLQKVVDALAGRQHVEAFVSFGPSSV